MTTHGFLPRIRNKPRGTKRKLKQRQTTTRIRKCGWYLYICSSEVEKQPRGGERLSRSILRRRLASLYGKKCADANRGCVCNSQRTSYTGALTRSCIFLYDPPVLNPTVFSPIPPSLEPKLIPDFLLLLLLPSSLPGRRVCITVSLPFYSNTRATSYSPNAYMARSFCRNFENRENPAGVRASDKRNKESCKKDEPVISRWPSPCNVIRVRLYFKNFSGDSVCPFNPHFPLSK